MESLTRIRKSTAETRGEEDTLKALSDFLAEELQELLDFSRPSNPFLSNVGGEE